MNLDYLRHPKEKTYYIVSVILSLIIHICTLGMFFLFDVLLIPLYWCSEQLFRSHVFGDAVKITPKQFPELFAIIQNQSDELNFTSIPEVFIYNGQGAINAFAVRVLSRKYIILMSNLIDLMLKRSAISELEMIIGHELGHHALKHTSQWRRMLLSPMVFIPPLSYAYSRGCEMSADRVGLKLAKDKKAAIRGLLSITLGSEALSGSMNLEEFVVQEQNVPAFFGFLAKVFATHPRMTIRVKELSYVQEFASEMFSEPSSASNLGTK